MRELRKRWHELLLHCHVRCASLAFPIRWRVLALAVTALAFAACRQAWRGLGPGGAALDRNADQLFGAMVIRYTQVTRDPKYEFARNRLNRNALVPSKVFDDSAIWTSEPSPVLRAMFVQGTFESGHYLLASRAVVTRPARVGDSRHVITLARLSPNEFVWDTSVDFALGTVSAGEVGALTTALLASAERASDKDLRDDYRAVAPRASAVLGILFSIDSMRATPFSDGTSDVNLTIGMHTDALKDRGS